MDDHFDWLSPFPRGELQVLHDPARTNQVLHVPVAASPEKEGWPLLLAKELLFKLMRNGFRAPHDLTPKIRVP